jgi:hypothetical protein
MLCGSLYNNVSSTSNRNTSDKIEVYEIQAYKY